jgi:hypothetical protein
LIVYGVRTDFQIPADEYVVALAESMMYAKIGGVRGISFVFFQFL